MGVFKTLKLYGFFKNNLYFYPRAILWALNDKFTKKRQLLSAEIFFESCCNFKCWHCSSTEYTEKKKDVHLSLEQLELIIKKLKRVNALAIAYVGGEPTVRKDLPDIIRMTNNYKILPAIITNAFLLTPEKVDELFAAGLANIGFSIQSMNEQTHDKMVQKTGAFRHLMKIIQYCLEKRYTISLCAVPTNENLANGDFEELMEFAKKRDIRVNVNLPAPVGMLLDIHSVMLSEESIRLLQEKYFPEESFLPDFKQNNARGKIYCPMGEKVIYILPDGEVCPCTFVQISYGNVLEEPLLTILNKLDNSDALANVQRVGQCPISMDANFIRSFKDAVKRSDDYPPKAENLKF